VEIVVPRNLTLKSIPDELYAKLKASAQVHRRSVNSEATACLETALLRGKISPEEHAARVRALRVMLPTGTFRAKDIDAFKREGRI